MMISRADSLAVPDLPLVNTRPQRALGCSAVLCDGGSRSLATSGAGPGTSPSAIRPTWPWSGPCAGTGSPPCAASRSRRCRSDSQQPALHRPPGLEPPAQDEVLLDVHDVALGHTTKMRWDDEGQWILSEEVVHPPIINTGTFQRAQDLLAARGLRDLPAAHARPLGQRRTVLPLPFPERVRRRQQDPAPAERHPAPRRPARHLARQQA